MYQDPNLILNEAIFTEWKEHYQHVFSQQTLLLEHRLQELPHFRSEHLARTIEQTPGNHYDLVRMGEQGSKKHEWRRGLKEGTPGETILQAIEKGRFWISLQGLNAWNEDYARLTDKIFADISERVPGFESFKHKTGLLVSSPNAQVYYHADIPGQSLWQIKGKKTVYIYPNSKPFVNDEQLEAMFLGKTEEEITYHPWYDDFAQKVVLEPGQAAHWPLNGPHRVENHDMVNISITTEHFTKEIRDFYAVVYANGLLRQLGISGNRHSVGVTKYAKMALSAGHKMVYRKLVKTKTPKAKPSFKINLDKPDLIEDL